MTTRQEELRVEILGIADGSGFGVLPKHDGNQPAIHGNHLGWVREAMVGTFLEWPDGGTPRDDLRNALMETWWGQSVYQLANLDSCELAGGTYDARTGRCIMPGQPPVEPPQEPPVEPPVEPPEPEPADPYVLRLQGGRFEARVEFATDEENDSESAHPVPLPQFGDAGGAFWFFSPDNPELFVKVVGPVRSKYWVFAAALSDVAFTLAVDDTKTGAVRFYKNNAGQFTGLARDTEAFEA